jgi:hypothetical protein
VLRTVLVASLGEAFIAELSRPWFRRSRVILGLGPVRTIRAKVPSVVSALSLAVASHSESSPFQGEFPYLSSTIPV